MSQGTQEGSVVNVSHRNMTLDHKSRQTQQMIRFFTGTALTLLCTRMIHRTMVNLKCMNSLINYILSFNYFFLNLLT